MANRLAQSQSPYLRQHAENPVDWWEWGPEAFAEAERRDRPILLSVGYAACHWCHVMAQESFEDPAVAAFMNAHFINVKADREERPDVDALYIRATTAMTGQAGWPMTCVLTPDGEPFFAGTYFPPEPQHGLPSFSQILQALAEAWRTRRDEIHASSQQIAEYLAERTLTDPQDIGADELDAAGETLLAEADLVNGGFGGAPKFPPPMVLEFLMRWASRAGNSRAYQVIDRTFEAMARVGLRDHLGGGFARYSVDASWQVPHFEKMLYDNALLLTGYLHWRRTLLHRGEQAQADWAEKICRDTVSFLLDDLRTDEGGFASSLDADSDGAEGTYYVWTPAQLRDVLGPDDARWAAELLHVTEEGTFENGASTLQLVRDPDDADRWQSVRTRLAAARSLRTRPARDDKIVAAWNGLVISALAEAGIELGEPSWLEAAEQAGTLLWDLHRAGTSEFRRTSMAGTASNHAAVLDDHALVAGAYQDLFLATGSQHWWDRASTLITRIAHHFTDTQGGWFDTADDAEKLLARPQDFQDNASPSGNSAALAALIRHAAVTGEDAAITPTIRRLGPLMTQAPRFAGWALAWAETWLAGPVQVAVVGEPGGPLHQAAIAAAVPGTIVGVSAGPNALALFENRGRRDGRDTAYVCRQFVCQLPVTSSEELRAQLQRQRV